MVPGGGGALYREETREPGILGWGALLSGKRIVSWTAWS